MPMYKADPTPQVKNVLEVVREKHRVDIKTSVAFEGTFNNNNDRDKFYSEYDCTNPDDCDCLKLWKVHALYCNGGKKSTLSHHMLKAFSAGTTNQYLTNGTMLRYIPENYLSFCSKTPKAHFLAGTSKVITCFKDAVRLYCFYPQSLHAPLSKDVNSPSYFYLFTLLMEMTCSPTDSNPIFHQVGVKKRQSKIWASCNPDLKEFAADIAEQAMHYAAAYLTEKG
eukprot:4037052-Ditylum_brightwellii.AAC.1